MPHIYHLHQRFQRSPFIQRERTLLIILPLLAATLTGSTFIYQHAKDTAQHHSTSSTRTHTKKTQPTNPVTSTAPTEKENLQPAASADTSPAKAATTQPDKSSCAPKAQTSGKSNPSSAPNKQNC